MGGKRPNHRSEREKHNTQKKLVPIIPQEEQDMLDYLGALVPGDNQHPKE